MVEVSEILAERQTTHGDFSDNSKIMQELKEVIRTGLNWDKLTSVQKESLEMIAHKIGRIMTGDPNVLDHWDDIAGYAKLVSERLQ